MKLTDAFDRVVILNLPFKTTRRERLTRHLEERGLADMAKVRWQRAWCGDWTGHPAWWSAGNGAFGCLMSHVQAIGDAIHDGLESVLILEDDVVFHPRASEWLPGLMEVLPEDWGQLYLGGQYLKREPVVVEGTEGRVMRPHNVNRTHAFALRKSAMAPVLRHVLHAPDYLRYATTETGMPMLEGNAFHIDHQLGRAHEREDWAVYSPRWWLAGQAAGDSNVSGRVNPELWWHWRSWGEKLPFVIVPRGLPDEERARIAESVWTGGTLIPGTLRDKGVKDAIAGDLRSWLSMIAGEAIERWKLPGIEVTPEEVRLVGKAWPQPLINDLVADALRGLRDYPANGLVGAE